MSFPAGLALVTVNADFRGWPNGTPSRGKAEFICKQMLVGPVDDVMVPPFTAVAPFTNGTFTIVLPATNDPEWIPQGWTYEVRISIGGKTNFGSLALPYNGGSVNLADVFNPISPVPGISYIPLSARGAPGGVAALGQDGYVPDAQLRIPILILDVGEEIPVGTLPNTLVLRRQV